MPPFPDLQLAADFDLVGSMRRFSCGYPEPGRSFPSQTTYGVDTRQTRPQMRRAQAPGTSLHFYSHWWVRNSPPGEYGVKRPGFSVKSCLRRAPPPGPGRALNYLLAGEPARPSLALLRTDGSLRLQWSPPTTLLQDAPACFCRCSRNRVSPVE